MGKATELDDFLDRQELTQDEVDERDRRPKVRVRAEVLDQALEADVSVSDVLSHLANASSQLVTLHDAESGATAIAVPVEQYVELVRSLIKDRELFQIRPGGGTFVPESTLSKLGVEQTNPQETWF